MRRLPPANWTRVLLVSSVAGACSAACGGAPTTTTAVGEPREQASAAIIEIERAPAPPEARTTAPPLRLAEDAPRKAQSGCLFEGTASHGFEMSLPNLPVVFATTHVGSIRLRFGQAPADAIELDARVRQLSFEVQAAPGSVSLYARAPLSYQGVFEALPDRPLRVEPVPSRNGQLRIAPRSWELPDHVAFRTPKPWFARCDQFSLAVGGFTRSPQKVQGSGVLRGAELLAPVPLFDRPGGKHVLDVHSGMPVDLLAKIGPWAKVTWEAEDGRFHGFVKDYNAVQGLFGHGRGAGTGGGKTSRCTAVAGLYVLETGTGVLHPVGRMLGGAAPTLIEPGAYPLRVGAASFVRIAAPSGLVVEAGFELAIADGDAARCLRAERGSHGGDVSRETSSMHPQTPTHF